MDPLRTWMTNIDIAILEFMRRYSDLALPPKAWHVNMTQDFDVSYTHLKRRLATLRDLDQPMVRQDPDRADMYEITEFGVEVVDKELSVEEVNELNPHEGGSEEEGADTADQ